MSELPVPFESPEFQQPADQTVATLEAIINPHRLYLVPEQPGAAVEPKDGYILPRNAKGRIDYSAINAEHVAPNTDDPDDTAPQARTYTTPAADRLVLSSRGTDPDLKRNSLIAGRSALSRLFDSL